MHLEHRQHRLHDFSQQHDLRSLSRSFFCSDSLMLFSPSTELDYTFAVIPCPPGLIPVSLNR